MNTYRKYLLGAVLILTATQAVPAQAGDNSNMNYGAPAAVREVQPPPPPPRAYRGTSGFFYSPSLGVYASANPSSEIFFIDGKYYRHQGTFWARSSRIDGKWKIAKVSKLPIELTRYSYDEICILRDRDYRHYRDGRWDRRHDRDDNRGDWGDRDRDRNEHGQDGYDRDRDRSGYDAR
jgi:hypothetical protein